MTVRRHDHGTDCGVVVWDSGSSVPRLAQVLKAHFRGPQVGCDLADTGFPILGIVFLIVIDRCVNEENPMMQMLVACWSFEDFAHERHIHSRGVFLMMGVCIQK